MDRNNDRKSIPIIFKSGVPQCSVLGLFLFLIYTVDFNKHVGDSSVKFFADDTPLFCDFLPNNYHNKNYMKKYILTIS